ncbi:ribosome quality control complex subunit 1 [Monosporozyma unispora]|nr:RQC (ribosome quality control complex) component [Kazachstania unispora]
MSSRALRKQQNDEELLAAILSKSEVKKKEETVVPKQKQPQNMFALMNDDEDSEVDNSIKEDSNSENEKIEPAKISLPSKAQRKKNQKKNKKKKNQKKQQVHDSGDEVDEDGDDEEFDKLLLQFQKKDIKKSSKTRKSTKDAEGDEFYTASESEYDDEDIEKVSQYYETPNVIVDEMKFDVSFSKFPISSLRSTDFNTDFKKLDPHTEFKLLFDDISAESLEDIDSMSSTSISPQQLKQIQRLRRLVRNWGGKDHRSVPNGPGGSVHRLQFTKVRNDWLPTPRGDLAMKTLNNDDLLDWQLWQRPSDWKDMIQQDLDQWKKSITFYKFEPLNEDLNKKAMTEFYLNVIAHPDHEALINLIASQAPYHVPGLLQVALITVRQGDKSNTNGLLQRALFVFDRALKTNVLFDSNSCQLPYIYFFNRQFYLAIFRYVLVLAQRGAVATACEWTKVLLSLSPMEDPLGCRYFMDHYLLLCNDYQYIINMSKSPLMNCYKEWYTWGFSMGVVLCYLKIGEFKSAESELLKCFKQHAPLLGQLYLEKLAGDVTLLNGLTIEGDAAKNLEYKTYLARFSMLWKSTEELSFLHNNLTNLFTQYKEGHIEVACKDLLDEGQTDLENVFYIENIPINLLRFAILSEESSVMGAIPANIWSDYEVFESDVLPPQPNSRESIDVIETVKSFINDKDLVDAQAMRMQDEDILNQIRQLSLNQYIQANETEQNEQQ